MSRSKAAGPAMTTKRRDPSLGAAARALDRGGGFPSPPFALAPTMAAAGAWMIAAYAAASAAAILPPASAFAPPSTSVHAMSLSRGSAGGGGCTPLRVSASEPSSSSAEPGLPDPGLLLPHLPLDLLSSQANAYCASYGLLVEERAPPPPFSPLSSQSLSSYRSAPVSLLPNAYPRSAFAEAQKLAPYFNELADRVSRDGEFLRDVLGGDVAEADEFTGRLLELYESIYGEKGGGGDDKGKFARGADRLGILRSDYMLNESTKTKNGKGKKKKREYELKQVELNTIAASFAGLAVRCSDMHRYLVTRFQEEGVEDFLEDNAKDVMGEGYAGSKEGKGKGVPENPALESLPKAMSLAHDRYVKRFLSSSSSKEGDDSSNNADGDAAVVLFVVQEGETNTVDQRALETALWKNHGISVVRMSLTEAGRGGLVLDERTGALTLAGAGGAGGGKKGKEVSLVYFRAGYAPTDYPSGAEWSGREVIERARCAKCPDLGYHLAGTKKVQQELARPGRLERFFPEGFADQEKVDGMRGAFAGLYSLGSDATRFDLNAVRDALSGGENKYVLKPQREGGGYNYYGKDLAERLRAGVEGGGGGGGGGGEATAAAAVASPSPLPPKARPLEVEEPPPPPPPPQPAKPQPPEPVRPQPPAPPSIGFDGKDFTGNSRGPYMMDNVPSERPSSNQNPTSPMRPPAPPSIGFDGKDFTGNGRGPYMMDNVPNVPPPTEDDQKNPYMTDDGSGWDVEEFAEGGKGGIPADTYAGGGKDDRRGIIGDPPGPGKSVPPPELLEKYDLKKGSQKGASSIDKGLVNDVSDFIEGGVMEEMRGAKSNYDGRDLGERYVAPPSQYRYGDDDRYGGGRGPGAAGSSHLKGDISDILSSGVVEGMRGGPFGLGGVGGVGGRDPSDFRGIGSGNRRNHNRGVAAPPPFPRFEEVDDEENFPRFPEGEFGPGGGSGGGGGGGRKFEGMRSAGLEEDKGQTSSAAAGPPPSELPLPHFMEVSDDPTPAGGWRDESLVGDGGTFGSALSVDNIVLQKDLAEYILMDRLFPPRQTAVLLRSGVVEGTGPSVSELGCFGTILTDSDGEVIANEYGGWILRTKFEDVDEGGVASGFATLSSPYLC